MVEDGTLSIALCGAVARRSSQASHPRRNPLRLAKPPVGVPASDRTLAMHGLCIQEGRARGDGIPFRLARLCRHHALGGIIGWFPRSGDFAGLACWVSRLLLHKSAFPRRVPGKSACRRIGGTAIGRPTFLFSIRCLHTAKWPLDCLCHRHETNNNSSSSAPTLSCSRHCSAHSGQRGGTTRLNQPFPVCRGHGSRPVR